MNTTKTLFDNGQVRMLVDDFSITVEELPRKPCKVYLRATRINTYYAVLTMHRDAFIPANILMAVKLDPADSYDTVVTLLRGAIAQLYKQGNEDVERIRGVSIHTDERHYTAVVPEGVEKLEIQCADFILSVEWTKFSAYSPNSDFQQADPHYTQIHEKSGAAARKLYKLAQAKKDELAKLSWGAFSEWLRAEKVAFDYSFSQWT